MRFYGTRMLAVIMIMTAGFHCAQAQINTEKFRKFYDEEGFLFNIKTTLAIKAGNTEYTSVKGTGRLDYNGNKFDYFLVGSYENKSATEKTIENQAFVHLRGMWYIAARTDWEFFAQQQFDEFIDLNSRTLAGTAIKYRLFEKQALADSNNTFDMKVSTGVMAEREVYNVDPENVKKELIRSTSFISFDWMIKNRLNFTGVIYYQPAFKNFKDYRIAAESAFEFAVIKRLYFTLEFTYRYNHLPVTDVKPYDLSIENGIRFEIK
ncbi:MAG: DUF481 domain-containing protein [Bacteroidales bacterium]